MDPSSPTPSPPGQIPPLSLAADAVLAVAYLTAWAVPAQFGVWSIGTLMLLIEVEAIVLLASVIVSEFILADRGIAWFGVLILAMLAAVVLKELFRFGFWGPALALGGLLANRLYAMRAGRFADPAARLSTRASSVAALVIYLASFILSRFLPALGGGLDVAAVAEHARWCRAPDELLWFLFGQGAKQEAPGPWVWCVAPHKALACGFVYFSVTVVDALWTPRWLHRRLASR